MKNIEAIKKYHVHIYTNSKVNLRGPHTFDQSSYEIEHVQLDAEIQKLKRLKAFAILIHPLSGNELDDHTSGAIWIGKRLPLDLSKLDF